MPIGILGLTGSGTQYHHRGSREMLPAEPKTIYPYRILFLTTGQTCPIMKAFGAPWLFLYQAQTHTAVKASDTSQPLKRGEAVF